MQHHTEISELVVGLIIVFVMCYYCFGSWSRLGLSLLWGSFAPDLTELHRRAVAWDQSKPGSKPDLILPRGNIFPMPRILSLTLPTSHHSLGADPLVTTFKIKVFFFPLCGVLLLSTPH